MSNPSQNLSTEITTGMRLSQQQIRFARLLDLNEQEIEEAVRQEVEENMALEEKDSANEKEDFSLYPFYGGSRQTDDNTIFTPADTEESLYDNLYAQLSERRLSPAIELGARYIIASMDSNGMIDRPLQSLANDMAFNEGIDLSPAEAREALDAVRSLDPPGIGAFSLQDSLELQLMALPASETRDNALRIVRETYEALTMRHKHRIISGLRLSAEKTDDALALIRSLRPWPGASVGNSRNDEATVIIPDYIVSNENGNLSISLNSRIPDLQINVSFEQAVNEMRRNAKVGTAANSEYIMRSYNSAREFIAILGKRQETMLKVMTAIVELQKEYFLTEDVYKLRPMMLKNVAEITGLDISVVSRATSDKYVATPWGIFPMRFFFSDSIGEASEGTEALTNRKIEDRIRALVDAEDKRHPLSDQKIMEEMTALGFDLSRRTVAKYRDRLKIPVARMRKEM